MNVDVKKNVGGCCGCAEERVVDYDINLKRDNDFPEEPVATKQEKMNDPAPLAAQNYMNVGDCKVRDAKSTEANPIGGVYKYKDNGATYQGQYKRGQRNGLGVLITQDGQVYSGNWANDLRNGRGHAFYVNGDYYQGQFLDNHKHGQGSLF